MYDLDQQQKCLRYGPPKLDTTPTQNVKNAWWSRTVDREDHENLVNQIESRMKKLN